MEHSYIARLTARLAGSALLGLSLTAIGPAAAGAAPMPDPCLQALAFEKSAAIDSNSAQARYDSAVAGLTANTRCTDQQMRLVNEGYLLSMRAAAAHDLHIGDWQRDMTRANSLLTQCTGYPGIAKTRVADDCRTQMQNNKKVADIYAAQAAASARPKPSATPAAGASPPAGMSSSASPAPRTSTTPRTVVPVPTPPH
jgi:hypothetical protein